MRLIDADRALEIVRDQRIAHPNTYHLTNYATLILREAPTVDAVGVVRCKDCVHKHAVTCEGIILCTYHGKMIQMHRSDFCSYGERKEGAE